MIEAVYTLYILNCLFLILTVLLQAGRGGGLAIGGGGGGGGGGQVFGAGGQTPFIQKVTFASAAGFMVLSMLLAYLSSTPASVESGTFDPVELTAPTTGTTAPAAE